MRCALVLGLSLVVLGGCEAEDTAGAVSVGDDVDRVDSGERTIYVPRPSSTGNGSQDETGAPTESGKPCTDDSDCGISSTCFQGTCVGQGALRFSLSWRVDTDYDLHVLTPNGIEISFSNPVDDGGMLDVDDCVGVCRVPGGTHVENIFFLEAPPEGTYEYWVHNFEGEIESSFELEVSSDGSVVDMQSDLLTTMEPAESVHYTYVY